MGDYFRLVCPADYRLPEMSGAARELFGKLLLCTTKRLKNDIDKRASMFSESKSGPEIVAAVPPSLLPEVDNDVWDHWNHVFSQLDLNSDGNLDLKDLQSSGLLSREVCAFLVKTLAEDESGSFQRNAFLAALLEVHSCRRTGFFG